MVFILLWLLYPQIVYQLIFHELCFMILGIGRVVQSYWIELKIHELMKEISNLRINYLNYIFQATGLALHLL